MSNVRHHESQGAVFRTKQKRPEVGLFGCDLYCAPGYRDLGIYRIQYFLVVPRGGVLTGDVVSKSTGARQYFWPFVIDSRALTCASVSIFIVVTCVLFQKYRGRDIPQSVFSHVWLA